MAKPMNAWLAELRQEDVVIGPADVRLAIAIIVFALAAIVVLA